MTPRQRDMLEAIRSFQEKFGYSPSHRELVAILKLKSTSEAHRLIQSLERHGRIRRLSNRARAIEIVENPTLPREVTQLTMAELVSEIRRRGLVVGTINTEIHHVQGEEPRRTRRFREITEEEYARSS